MHMTLSEYCTILLLDFEQLAMMVSIHFIQDHDLSEMRTGKVWTKAAWSFCFCKTDYQRGPMTYFIKKKIYPKFFWVFFSELMRGFFWIHFASWSVICRSFCMATCIHSTGLTTKVHSNATGGRLDHLSLTDWQCYRALGGTLQHNQHILQVRFSAVELQPSFNKKVFPNDLTEVVEWDTLR